MCFAVLWITYECWFKTKTQDNFCSRLFLKGFIIQFINKAFQCSVYFEQKETAKLTLTFSCTENINLRYPSLSWKVFISLSNLKNWGHLGKSDIGLKPLHNFTFGIFSYPVSFALQLPPLVLSDRSNLFLLNTGLLMFNVYNINLWALSPAVKSIC